MFRGGKKETKESIFMAGAAGYYELEQDREGQKTAGTSTRESLNCCGGRTGRKGKKGAFLSGCNVLMLEQADGRTRKKASRS